MDKNSLEMRVIRGLPAEYIGKDKNVNPGCPVEGWHYEDAKSLLRVEDTVNQVAFTAANRHDCANAEEILKIMSDVSKQLVKAINLMLNEKKKEVK